MHSIKQAFEGMAKLSKAIDSFPQGLSITARLAWLLNRLAFGW